MTIRSPHLLDAAEELKKLSRDQYSLAELQKKPLPEGVDPKKLESYLSEEEFKVSTQSCCCIVCGYCKFDCMYIVMERLLTTVSIIVLNQ